VALLLLLLLVVVVVVVVFGSLFLVSDWLFLSSTFFSVVSWEEGVEEEEGEEGAAIDI
jgi:hypothetical protein